MNFLKQLPEVEQYHTVNISSTWLDPKGVIGEQFKFAKTYFSYYIYKNGDYYNTTLQQVAMISNLPTIQPYFP